jgi:hypothetical protein
MAHRWVKANKELFNEWMAMSEAIGLLGAIVKNSCAVEVDGIYEWAKLAEESKVELQNLIDKTSYYLTLQDRCHVNHLGVVDYVGELNFV